MYNKLKNMKNCYMTKQIGGESFFFEDNVYTTIELKHVKCFTLFYLMTISNMITQIENEIQIIEYYRDHLIQFKKRRNFKEATKRIRKINENYFKAIELKEIEFTKIFEENLGFLNRFKMSKEALSNEYKMNFNKANDEEIENKLKSEVENLNADDLNLNQLKVNEMDAQNEEDNLSSGKKKRASIFDSIINR